MPPGLKSLLATTWLLLAALGCGGGTSAGLSSPAAYAGSYMGQYSKAADQITGADTGFLVLTIDQNGAITGNGNSHTFGTISITPGYSQVAKDGTFTLQLSTVSGLSNISVQTYSGKLKLDSGGNLSGSLYVYYDTNLTSAAFIVTLENRKNQDPLP